MYKIGHNTEYWYDENNPEESLRYIAECGIESIDYDICSFFDATFDLDTMTSFFDKSIEELCVHYDRTKKAMKDNHLVYSQWHGIFPMYYPDDEKRTEYILQITDKMIALCAYMECPAIVMHAWTGKHLTKEEEMDINLKLYRRMIPAAKKYGVKICLENLFSRYSRECVEGACSDAREAVQYIDTLNKEAGEEVFCFCLDTGHANLLGKNLYQYVKTLGARLQHLHINENEKRNDNHMIPYTQLDIENKKPGINWDEFLRGLKEVGYQGDLCFETHKGFRMLPEEVRQDGVRLISSIGRYFRKRLTE